MEVETETAQWKTEHKGEIYYFCSPGCLRSFEEDPEKYLSGDHGHEGHSH
jgi:YHS domain-containing protein